LSVASFDDSQHNNNTTGSKTNEFYCRTGSSLDAAVWIISLSLLLTCLTIGRRWRLLLLSLRLILIIIVLIRVV
jgi:hypothetical protein